MSPLEYLRKEAEGWMKLATDLQRQAEEDRAAIREAAEIICPMIHFDSVSGPRKNWRERNAAAIARAEGQP